MVDHIHGDTAPGILQISVFSPSRNMVQIHVMFELTFSPFLYKFLAFEGIKRVNSRKCCAFKVLGQRLEILKGGGTVLQEFHQWLTDALRICLHEFFYYWHYSSFPDIKLCDVWPPEIRAASKRQRGRTGTCTASAGKRPVLLSMSIRSGLYVYFYRSW